MEGSEETSGAWTVEILSLVGIQCCSQLIQEGGTGTMPPNGALDGGGGGGLDFTCRF